MVEVVVSSEGGLELRGHQTEAQKERTLPASQGNKIKAEDGVGNPYSSSSSSVTIWERFLQKMAVRVLLVETDDSTRQIIAALLRKCTYRVAAVPDGLRAWELLKGRSHNIDLILTEVELPLISGYSLLTLIMEHDICKNIPVIMMSSHDSVSAVYKCMLKGATDFLVKPIRKNELRNLWQHVWRKQSGSRSGLDLAPRLDGSAALQKVEATAENHAISNHSSGNVECIQRYGELDKGSDVQSSCSKPKLEAEMHSIKPKDDVIIIEEEEDCHQESRKMRGHYNDADVNYATKQGEGHNMNPIGCEQVNVIDQISKCHNVANRSSGEAIDLIGASDNYPKGASGTAASNARAKKIDIIPLPLLDLSLKRSHPSGSVNQVKDEKCGLNHSDASAFSRYVNKPLQPRNSSPSSCNQHKVNQTNSGKQQSNHITVSNSDTHRPSSMIPILAGEPSAVTFPYHHQQETRQPVPYRGLNVTNGFGSLTPQMFCTSSLSSQSSHLNDFSQLNPCYPYDRHPTGSPHLKDVLSRTISHAIDLMDHIKHDQTLENLEGQDIAPWDQHANSSLYNVHISHHNSTGSDNNVKISSISIVKGASKSGQEEGCHVVHEGGSPHRSLQREVALTKFRLKRKDRCFEKKVRYESRKKLAEQRPRVKGQFVRQVPNQPQPRSSLAG